MKVSANFNLEDYVPSEVFAQYGENSIWFVDPRLFTITQFIRDRYNVPCYVNGTLNGQVFNYSGLRTVASKDYTPLSQHTLGKAVDLKGIDSATLRTDIITNYSTIWKPLGLTTIEADTNGWVHFDVRNTNRPDLFIVPIPVKK